MPKGIKNETPVILDPIQEEREIIFMQALRQVLVTLRLHNDDRLRAKIGPDRLTDVSLEFFAYLEAGAEELNKLEKIALSVQLLRSLSKYITNTMNYPVTLKTLLDSVGLLEPAVEDSFPGYWGSKLLKYTILPGRVVA